MFSNQSFLRWILILLCVLPSALFPQSLMNEMEIEDISSSPEINSVIVRDKTNAMLIVKSQITSLRFESNNIINKVDLAEPGKWYIYLSPGTHRISFQADGFLTTRLRFFFNPGEVKGVMIRAIPASELNDKTIIDESIKKETGIIYINTQPPEAEVFLNDESKGDSPLTLLDVASGEHTVRVKWNEQTVSEELVTLAPDEVKRLEYSIEDLKYISSKVTILSEPPDAKIFWNGQLKGKTPLLIDNVSPGEYYIIAQKNEKMQVSKIEIKSNEKKTLHFDLQNDYLSLKNLLQRTFLDDTNSNLYLNNMLIKDLHYLREAEIANIFEETRFGIRMNKTFNFTFVKDNKIKIVPVTEIGKSSSEKIALKELDISIVPIFPDDLLYFNGIFVGKGKSHIRDLSKFTKGDLLYVFDYNEILCISNDEAFFVRRELHPEDSLIFDTNTFDDAVLIARDLRFLGDPTKFAIRPFSEVNFSVEPDKFILQINNFSRIRNVKKLYVPPGIYEFAFFSNHSSTMGRTQRIKYEVVSGERHQIRIQF